MADVQHFQADLRFGFQAGTRGFTCQTSQAHGAEQEALWPQLVRIFPLYEEDAHKTERQIPVVFVIAQH